MVLTSYKGKCAAHFREKLTLDCVLEQAERAVLKLRTLTEMIRPRSKELSRKPDAPEIPNLVGGIEVNDFGWVHLTLNSLLPNCKYKTPLWLQNTLSALLLGYQKSGRKLPKFECAVLIIEEYYALTLPL